jgi:beta-glucanase (GH16 family)
MDWDEERIELYVDDELVNEVDVAAAVNGDRRQSHPFREPHYLILNLAVGGTQGGDPTGTDFPAKFEVDFVRVYQQLPAAGGSE